MLETGRNPAKLSLPMRDYLRLLKDKSNKELRLRDVMAPFGILPLPTTATKGLLVGHLLEALVEDCGPEGGVDCFDIAITAASIGCEEAETFLRQVFPLMSFDL